MVNLRRLLGLAEPGKKKTGIPPDIERLLDRHDRPDEQLRGIEKLLTDNQVRLEKLKREFHSLELSERQEKEKIEAGDLSERAEKFVLGNLKRLGERLEAIEGEMRVLTENVGLLTRMEGKIRKAQAMTLRGFSDEQIEEMLLQYGEKEEEYLEAVEAARAETEHDPVRLQQDAELAEMKRKILAEKKAREARARDEEEPAPAKEKPAARKDKSKEKEAEKPRAEPERESAPRKGDLEAE